NALLQLGRTGDALGAFDRALALRPDHVEALVGRGSALMRLDRQPDALAAFTRAGEVQGGHGPALPGRGRPGAAARPASRGAADLRPGAPDPAAKSSPAAWFRQRAARARPHRRGVGGLRQGACDLAQPAGGAAAAGRRAENPRTFGRGPRRWVLAGRR